jgi:hypothetical protein
MADFLSAASFGNWMRSVSEPGTLSGIFNRDMIFSGNSFSACMKAVVWMSIATCGKRAALLSGLGGGALSTGSVAGPTSKV